jgi:hypothetical protein
MGTGGMAQITECLPSKQQVLSSIPSTSTKEKRKQDFRDSKYGKFSVLNTKCCIGTWPIISAITIFAFITIMETKSSPFSAMLIESSLNSFIFIHRYGEKNS